MDKERINIIILQLDGVAYEWFIWLFKESILITIIGKTSSLFFF